jgi:hypothetical protein
MDINSDLNKLNGSLNNQKFLNDLLKEVNFEELNYKPM